MTSNSDDSRVGYKRPPMHSRFKPGQSGNPKGRPRPSRSFEAEFLEELTRAHPRARGRPRN